MKTKGLGKVYQDREVIIRQGEKGDHVYIVQEGHVEVIREHDGVNYQIAILGETDFFGEMAVFGNVRRAATVRAIGHARVLTIDKADFLSRVKEDPSLAFHLVEVMAARMRELNQTVVELRRLCFEYGIPADVGTAQVDAEEENLDPLGV